MHGTLYDFIRDDNFNAPNALSGTKLPMDQQQYGGSLGGPIVRNRTFYFANFEQRLLDQTGLVTILPAERRRSSTPDSRRSATRVRRSRTGIYPNPVHSANFLGKVDHQVSGSDQLTVRYSLYHVTSDNSRGAGALNAPTASAGLDNIDHSLAFGNTWTISTQDRQRNARAVRVRRLEGAADRPDWTGGQHRRRGVVRHAVRAARRGA